MVRETYVDFIATARELINEFGRDCYLVELDNAALDPLKPWRGPGESTVLTKIKVPGAFVPAVSNLSGLGKSWIGEELLARVEQVLIVAPVDGYDLEKFHQVLDDDNTRWIIEWGQELRPGNAAVIYALGVKR